MRLATLKNGTRDGRLVLVSPDGLRRLDAGHLAPSLQAALDDWDRVAPQLRALEADFASGAGDALAPEQLMSPLPRAYEWLDGSAFLNHVELVRRARGAEIPDFLKSDPLVYQGGSGGFLGPRDPFPLPDPEWGLDLEGEVACILGDVPRGCSAEEAARHVRLLTLANDWSYRNLIPGELAKGFGFVVGKPATAFAPFAVTPDELGHAFRNGRVHLPLRVWFNGERLGEPQAGEEMHFSFFELIAHVARTRALSAGTVLGSGTVSNRDPSRGTSCLAERRMLEQLNDGAARTRYLLPGDVVRIEMLDEQGRSLFGAIEQRVVAEGSVS